MHQYFEWIYLQYTGIPVAPHSNFLLFWKQFQRTNRMAIRVCRKWIQPKQYKRLLLRYTGWLWCQHEKLFDTTVWTATAQNYNKSFPPIEHRIGREGLVHGIYFRLSWFQSSLLLIYFRYGGRDRRGVASLRYRICAEITDLLRENKLCLVWFLCARKTYPV